MKFNFGLNNITSKFSSWKENQEINKLQRSLAASTNKQNEDKRLYPKILQQKLYRNQIDIQNWNNALNSAEDPLRFDRRQLIAIYRQAVLDLHLVSQMRTPLLTIKAQPFAIVDKKTGKEYPELKELFAKRWFEDFLEYAIEAEWWGFSVIEIESFKKSDSGLVDTEIDSVVLIPRQNVKPEWGLINPDVNQPTVGYDFITNPDNYNIIDIGRRTNLGLLLVASKATIRKDFSISDWSRYSERFGLPYTIGKTNSKDQNEVNAMFSMLQNMGSGMVAVIPEGDSVELVESSKTDGSKIFLDFANFLDQQISKAINGQTGSSDEKAFAGSADVHKDILDTFNVGRLRDLQMDINDKLLPLLIKLGYPLENKKLKYTALDYKPIQQDNQPNNQDPQKGDAQKKNPFLTFSKVQI